MSRKSVYRIVVETGADFSANVGDEAYFAAMVDLFKRRFAGAIDIVKFANEPEKIARRYGIRSIYSGSNLRRRLAALWPTVKAIASADLYVWGGGQMPLDSHGVLSVIYRFHRPLLAKLLGVPVMSYAVGAGPLDMPHSRVIVRHVMNSFDLITVRDRYSVGLLRQVGVRKPIHQTVDSALVLEPASKEEVEGVLRAEGVPLDRPLLAVVPWGPAFRKLKSIVPVIFRRKHFTPENLRRLEHHCAVIAAALDTFVQRHDLFVLFVAMDRSRGHGFDDEVALRTIEKMKHKERTHLLQGVYHPKVLKGILGRCEMVLGSRMHGLILATGEGVPTAGICFTEKIRDFARLTGQENSYIGVEQMRSPEDLLVVLERCWSDLETSRQAIEPVLGQFRRMVEENVERLAGLLRRRRRLHPLTRPLPPPLAQSERPRNINAVQRRGLCTACGICYALCPRNNIHTLEDWDGRVRFRTKDEDLCTDCGLCRDVCPGLAVDFEAARRHFLEEEPNDALIGAHRQLLATRSTDSSLRSRATSGGTVSEICRFLLEEQLVQAVLVTTLDTTDTRPRPVSFLAREPEDLNQLKGSLYITAPACSALRELREDPRLERVAMVGLGCQVQALRAAQRRLPWLRRRVGLVVGLFCGHGMRPAGTWHLLHRLRVRPEEVAELAYRHGPMPGSFRVRTRQGRVRSIPMRDYGYALTAYGDSRCSMCVDPLCELADLSVGDAWLPEFRGRGDWNITIARTPAGQEVLEKLIRAGRLESQPIGRERLVQAQRLQLYGRERGAWARARLLHLLGRATPYYRGIRHAPLRPADYLRTLQVGAAQLLAQARWTQGLMVLAAGLLRKLARARSAKKDALIGRNRQYSEKFFSGEEYRF